MAHGVAGRLAAGHREHELCDYRDRAITRADSPALFADRTHAIIIFYSKLKRVILTRRLPPAPATSPRLNDLRIKRNRPCNKLSTQPRESRRNGPTNIYSANYVCLPCLFADSKTLAER